MWTHKISQNVSQCSFTFPPLHYEYQRNLLNHSETLSLRKSCLSLSCGSVTCPELQFNRWTSLAKLKAIHTLQKVTGTPKSLASLELCRSLCWMCYISRDRSAPKLLSVIRCTPSSVKGLSAAWKTGSFSFQPVRGRATYWQHVSHEKILLTIQYTGCLIGILVMVYCNPHITG